MSFKRSPSKVWWGSESLEFREVSSSPGSQDSGFSDAEGSPQNTENNRKNLSGNKENNGQGNKEPNNNTPKTNNQSQLVKNIFKGTVKSNENLNLASNYKEKLTPVKQNIDHRLVKSDRKNSPHALRKFATEVPFSEPPKRQRYIKHSPKVTRKLFTSQHAKECVEIPNPNQYSKLTLTNSQSTEATNEEEENSRLSLDDYDTSSEISGTKSLPLTQITPPITPRLGRSAPSKLNLSNSSDLQQYEAVTCFNSTSSECESELEQIFEEFAGPEHTSTPKVLESMRHRRRNRERLQDRLRLRYPDNERVPPISTDGVTVDNNAVIRWLEEARMSMDQECTTTLQFKSIAAELNQKVSHLAACATTILRGLLSHCRCIEADYRQLNSESTKTNYLVQSLAGNILDFLKIHTSQVSSKTLRLYDQIKDAEASSALVPLRELFNEWQKIESQVLVNEIRKLVGKLEDPTSDIDLRATLTGITSVALRNTDLIEHFVKTDIIPVLLILCERCEGSSLRALILRALSTMCTKSTSIRYFEKYSGIQIITDTLEDNSKPEPERSEAVALLAQVTAPWLEDNHSIKGLQLFAKRLISTITKFAATTKCCQNLLLCAAALANLSSLDNHFIQYLIECGSASILLSAVKNRGPMVSVYLLEQVATLLANMAAVELARKQLTATEAPAALIHFLRSPKVTHNEDVERRLQQKSVIALSRLCSDVEASKQVVENGGLNKLIQLCRERNERFSSDAVLVAALATLRKIAEACGKDVLNAEDCQELVEPKLLDSFLAYSTQNESYV